MRAGASPVPRRGEGWLRALHAALVLLLLDELHATFCGIVTLAVHFSGLGGVRSQLPRCQKQLWEVRLTTSEGRALQLHVSCSLQAAFMVCHCLFAFQSRALHFHAWCCFSCLWFCFIQLCPVGSCAVLVSSGTMESSMTVPGAHLTASCVLAVWLFHPAHVEAGRVL